MMFKYTSINKMLFATSLLALVACGKKMNERDSLRERTRASAEMKRSELNQIVGNYYGTLIPDNSNIIKNVSLTLEIRDLPYNDGSMVDPVLIPTLSGTFKFHYGDFNDPNSTESFAIKSAEFIAKSKMINLVVGHTNFKDIVINLKHDQEILDGTWSTSGFEFNNGNVSLQLNKKPDLNLSKGLNGAFRGFVVWDDLQEYQFLQFDFKSVFQHDYGLKVSANTRIYFGNSNSDEYLLYKYSHVDINPLTASIIIRDENLSISFIGRYFNGLVEGEWYSGTKKLGKLTASQDTTLEPDADYGLVQNITGVYKGLTKSDNSSPTLPEKVMITLNTKQDLDVTGVLVVSGNIRFYLGDFGSNEYEELIFDQVQFNHYTRTLSASTSGKYKLNLTANFKDDKIFGKIVSNSLGELAKFEVQK